MIARTTPAPSPVLMAWVELCGVGVTGINKTTDAVTLTYDPWGRARLDDAVGELECQGRRMVADREGVGADN